MSDTVNDLPVIAATPFHYVSLTRSNRGDDSSSDAIMRPSRIILVDRGESEIDRYVTAEHCVDDSSWTWAHYFFDKIIALASFDKRAQIYRARYRLATEIEIEAEQIRKAGELIVELGHDAYITLKAACAGVRIGGNRSYIRKLIILGYLNDSGEATLEGRSLLAFAEKAGE